MTSSRSGPRDLGLRGGELRLELAVRHLGFLELGLGFLRPSVDLRLPLGVVGAGQRFALLGELVGRDDADHTALVYLLQALDLEDRVERLLPGHVAQGDRELALDVVARNDIPAALRTENAEEVDDVGVLELERDQLGPVRGCGAGAAGAGVVAAWATTTGASAAGRTGSRWAGDDAGNGCRRRRHRDGWLPLGSRRLGRLECARGLRRIGRLRRLGHSRKDPPGPRRAASTAGRSRPSPALRGRR